MKYDITILNSNTLSLHFYPIKESKEMSERIAVWRQHQTPGQVARLIFCLAVLFVCTFQLLFADDPDQWPSLPFGGSSPAVGQTAQHACVLSACLLLHCNACFNWLSLSLKMLHRFAFPILEMYISISDIFPRDQSCKLPWGRHMTFLNWPHVHFVTQGYC